MLKKHQKLTLEGQDMLTKKKIHKLVDYSIKKYGKAYKKLEEYDQGNKTMDWEKESLDRQIRKALMLAWEAGKKQVKTPYEYTLDTDKIGQPLYDYIIKARLQAKKEVIEEVDLWIRAADKRPLSMGKFFSGLGELIATLKSELRTQEKNEEIKRE